MKTSCPASQGSSWSLSRIAAPWAGPPESPPLPWWAVWPGQAPGLEALGENAMQRHTRGICFEVLRSWAKLGLSVAS